MVARRVPGAAGRVTGPSRGERWRMAPGEQGGVPPVGVRSRTMDDVPIVNR